VREETRAAIRSAEVALRLARSRRGADRIRSKGGRDLVTETDVLCEDAIREELGRAFPDHPVVGEERGGQPRATGGYWLVDPICGTRPYASGLSVFCSNIALVEDGVVTAAAIGVGETGEIMYAEKGAGARVKTFDGNERIGVSDRSDTIWIDGRPDEASDAVRRALSLDRWYVWMFSSSVAYAYLAAGRISGILHFRRRAEDPPVHTAAGCFVAEEAGAVVLDLDRNRPWGLDTRAILVAATSALQDDLSGVAGRGASNTET
jgi:myo-inositol-1(or 4)-monophosphatase